MDFLYSPLVRAYLREVAIRTPVLPGQIWNLPGIGEVKVTGVTDFHVSYRIEGDSFSDDYMCPRKDFVIHSIREREASSPEVPPLTVVIPFNKQPKENE